ncbi:MAG: ldh [Clostridia bacterium]|jgi:L-lactate dehydrogenase|uniref:L-lactate dehydrogenase n=1 Tax=Petroclostridium xylanilyticum TaxID=1792311 RepID=UPI000B983745|nr:L-lactate dehydrogenase [Petroclostridium xylanilyticum]MBZ4646257.1 ldh [Clostridia bacterium]
MLHKITGKISVVGAGFVGSTTAYTLMLSGLVSEIVIVDINKDKAEGDVMDMNHGMPFVRPVQITAGDFKDCHGSDIVIITAGANQKPGETRIDLVKKNTEIFKSIVPEIIKYCEDSILLIVTNPIDILTYVTLRISGLSPKKVIGSGTVLDTSRFKFLLSQHTGVDARNIHAYILGEHGDTEVAAWSLTNIAGMTMEEFCNYCAKCEGYSKQETYENVKNAAYKIIEKKGATYYAVALAVRRIVECILRDERSILTVSSLMTGQYGINDVCLSLPTIVNEKGIDRILEVPLADEEVQLLRKSASALKDVIKQIPID